MLSIHRPAPPTGFSRISPTSGASPQQIAEYYRNMLVADGAIPSAFHPFEPSSLSAFGCDTFGCDNGADFFYGRTRVQHALSPSPSPGEASSQLDARQFSPTSNDLESQASELEEHAGAPWNSAFPDDKALSCMNFGLSRIRPSCEDDIIAAQLANVHRIEQDFMALGLPSLDEDDEMIREQILLMQEAQRLRGLTRNAVNPSTSVGHDSKPEVPEEDKTDTGLGAACVGLPAKQDEADLEAALKLSSEMSAATDDAALKQALQLSEQDIDIRDKRVCDSDEEASAGMDIPFETPKSLLSDTPAPSAAAASECGVTNLTPNEAPASKSARRKNKRGKAAGAQV